MSAGQEVVFDRESVLDMVDGEIDFAQELVQMFLDDVDAQVDQIRGGISTGDAEIVQRVSHRLKTSVGNLGGRAAQVLVKDLEHQARAGDLSLASDTFARFETELERFAVELRSFLTTGG